MVLSLGDRKMINLSPIHNGPPLTFQRTGGIVSINGTVYDLTRMADGDTLPRDAVMCPALLSDVTLVSGDLNMTLAAGYNAPGTEAERFPDPITDTPSVVGLANGPIDWSQIVTAAAAAEAATASAQAAMVASAAQTHLALHIMGLTDTVQQIAAQEDGAAVVLQYAAEFRRNNDLIVGLGAAGFTPEQIDDIFIYAQSLVI